MYIRENFVSSLYLLIQSSTLKKCIEHCLMALATSHVYIYIYLEKNITITLIEQIQKEHWELNAKTDLL